MESGVGRAERLSPLAAEAKYLVYVPKIRLNVVHVEIQRPHGQVFDSSSTGRIENVLKK